MNVSSQFIQPDDSRWPAVLGSTAHDFYHRPEYVSFAATHSGGQAQAFFAQCGTATLLVPLVVRALPQELGAPSSWRDAVSPYGYASPLLIGGRRAEEGFALWQSFVERCLETSILSVFLRSHPLLPLPDGVGEVGALMRVGETVVIDLTRSEAELWQQTRENHRRSIRRLEKDGFRAVIDDWSGYDQFAPLYWATMQRAGAAEEYLFSREYFIDLKRLGQGFVHFCKVLTRDGEVAAVGLFFCHQQIIQFHLSGTAEAYLDRSPTKLMFSFMRTWAKAQGCTSFHLGGGVGCQNDSLFAFKAGFSGDRAEFYTIRLVCDLERYSRLSVQTDPGTGNPDLTRGYFPAYRQPRVGA